MRKSLWIMPSLLLFSAIGAPSAHADTYTVTFTCTGGSGIGGSCVSLPTAPDVSFPGPTTLDVTVYGNTFAYGLPTTPASLPSDIYSWIVCDQLHSCTALLFGIFDATTNTGGGQIALSPAPPFCLSSSLSCGEEFGTVVFTPLAATPEPGSVALLLLGLGTVFVMRKRIVQA